MTDPSEPDGTHVPDDGLRAPLNVLDNGIRPLYRARPREFYLLWFIALLTYGVGDTATTALAVFAAPTLAESNLMVATVLSHGGLVGFLLLKLLVFLALLAISVRGSRRGDRFAHYWPPVAAVLFGVLLTGWNLRLLATAG